MRYVIVLGIARCGTSYLTRCLHAAGIPMWRQPPATVHSEDPAAIEAASDLACRHGTTLLERLRADCDEAGVWPCGFKEPHLIAYRREMIQLFPPADSRYIICCRDLNRAARSLHRLTQLPLESCRAYYYDWLTAALDWLQFHRPQVILFNYDGDINRQQHDLSLQLQRPVDLVSDWKPTDGHL